MSEPGPGSVNVNSADDHQSVAAIVRQFIAMMQAGNIARLELQHRDLRLSLRAHEVGAVPVLVAPSSAPHGRPDQSLSAVAPDGALHVVTAPMIGTYYEASAPGEPAFVQVGDRVEEGQTVGIIEAMKIMNEIAADRAGLVAEILVKNGQTVEYGTPLIKLDLSA